VLAAQLTSVAQRDAVIVQHEDVMTQREAMIESLHIVIEKQLQKLAVQELQLIRLLRRQYGPQKERIDPDQLTLADKKRGQVHY